MWGFSAYWRGLSVFATMPQAGWPGRPKPQPTVSLRKDSFADCQSTRAQGPEGCEGEDEDARARRRAAEARRVHACHDADSEEAELGPPEGRACPPHER